MNDDLKNQLIQLRKDCSQMQSTIENLQDDEFFGVLDADIIDHVDTVLDNINQLWDQLDQLDQLTK